jgi:hypothetical protein
VTPPDDGAGLPELKVYRDERGRLRFKLPDKGARWQGAFASLEELVPAARGAGMPEPFAFDFLTLEEARA